MSKKKGDMFYIALLNDRYLFYTDTMVIIKRLEYERGIKFKVLKVSKSELDNILTEYQYLYTKMEYDKNLDKIYLPQEERIVVSIAENKFIKIHELYLDLRKELQFLRLNDNERSILMAYFKKLELLSDDLLSDESSVTVNECFDIKRLLKELVQLDKRRGG